MKRALFVFSLFMSISFICAQTYYLNVNLKDGTKVIYPVSKINKMDFSGIMNPNAVEKFSHIVKSFKLLQNYPNPFNPSTTIQYEIPRNGKVKISIYDINGKLVKTIADGTQPAGFHKVLWDGKTLEGNTVASGFYIYTINFDGIILSKKMLLIK